MACRAVVAQRYGGAGPDGAEDGSGDRSALLAAALAALGWDALVDAYSERDRHAVSAASARLAGLEPSVVAAAAAAPVPV